MKRSLGVVALAVLSVGALRALADVGWKNSGVVVGPVRDVNCRKDGGLSCYRDAGVPIGDIFCNTASTTETGCVTTAAQSFSGNKTFTGNVKAVQLDAGAAFIGSLILQGASITSSAGFASKIIIGEGGASANLVSIPGLLYIEGDDDSDDVRFTGTYPAEITGYVTAARAATTGGAFIFKVANTLDANDAVMNIGPNVGSHVAGWIIDVEGDVDQAGSILIGNVNGDSTAILQHKSFTASLDFDFSGAGITCQALTIAATGAVDGDTVGLGLPNALGGASGVLWDAWVSAADTISVRGCDVTSSNVNPAASTVRVDLWKH